MVSLVVIPSAFAMEQSRTEKKVDLHGDGKFFESVNFPFPYFEKEHDDRYSFIHQGGYKVYEIEKDQNEVALIGYLKICIGIAVTDSTKVIVFHKYFANSLDSMGKIIKQHLDLSNQKALFARLYSTQDDLEWGNSDYSSMHGGNSHAEEIENVKNFIENIGFSSANIMTQLFNVRDKNNNLQWRCGDGARYGRYDSAASYIALRLNQVFENQEGRQAIKFASIDPVTEDVLALSKTWISAKELEDEDGALYDEIPELFTLESTDGTMSYGYEVQRKISETRINEEATTQFISYFGMNVEDLLAKDLVKALAKIRSVDEGVVWKERIRISEEESSMIDEKVLPENKYNTWDFYPIDKK